MIAAVKNVSSIFISFTCCHIARSFQEVCSCQANPATNIAYQRIGCCMCKKKTGKAALYSGRVLRINIR